MKNKGKTTRAEFRAIIALVVILAGAISFPAIYENLFPQPDPGKGLSLEFIIDTLSSNERFSQRGKHATPEKYQKTRYEGKSRQAYLSQFPGTGHQRPSPYRSEKAIQCRTFDPNAISTDELIEMGVNSYVATNMIRYRESGAIFRQAEDIRRIYGMDSTLFTALSSCIQINSDLISGQKSAFNATLDINTADIEAWRSLPGIGEVLATRIVNYRTHLGGFHAIDQVAETYGLPAETFQQLRARLQISNQPGKLNLNTVTVEELAMHPYVSQRQAEAIVNFRSHHGDFSVLGDLTKIYSISNDWLQRMTPYLSCGGNTVSEESIVAR